MAEIPYREQRTFSVAADTQSVYDFFSSPERLREALDDVEKCESLADGKVHWVFRSKAEQGIRFQANYVVVFEGNGTEHVRWRSVEGNVSNDGEVRIRALPSGGSEIDYRETIAPDLPITPLTACLVRPLVTKELKQDLGRFLERAQLYLS